MAALYGTFAGRTTPAFATSMSVRAIASQNGIQSETESQLVEVAEANLISAYLKLFVGTTLYVSPPLIILTYLYCLDRGNHAIHDVAKTSRITSWFWIACKLLVTRKLECLGTSFRGWSI
jgi:hypothetical protein